MCIPSPQLVVEGEKTKLDKCLARHFRPIPIICRRKPHVQGIMAGQTRFDFDYVFMICDGHGKNILRERDRPWL